MKSVIFFIALLLTGSQLKSQHQKDMRLFIYAGGGLDYYTGDLKDNMLPETDFLKPFGTVGIDFQLKNIINIGLGYFQGSVVGADRFGENNPTRNFEFRSPIKDYHLLTKLNLVNFKGKYPFTPGILIGVGFFYFNPEVFADGVWREAQPLGTEGQNLGGNYPEPYKLNSYNFKTGFEITYRLSCKWYLDAYVIYSKGFTDHLDDVSGKYPNHGQLIESTNGSIVENYTYTYDNGFIPDEGTDRGNSDFKDGYWNIGIHINYQIWGKCQGLTGISRRTFHKSTPRECPPVY